MKESYEKNMIEKIEKDMRLNKKHYMRIEPIYGEKISIDAVEYFNSIVGIKVYAYDTEIASYDYIKKVLTHRNNIRNIEICKAQVQVLNDFLQYEKYYIKDKVLTAFEKYKDEVDADCNMSDYEIACMYEFN